MAGMLGAWAACPFFSSEKSCLITSKKLLNGLPGCTEQRQKKKRKERKGGREGGKRENNRRMNQGPTRAGARERGAAAASGAGSRGARGLWAAGWGPGRRGPSSSARPPITLSPQRWEGQGQAGPREWRPKSVTLLLGGLEPHPRPARVAQRGHRGQQRTDRRMDRWTGMELGCGEGWGRQPKWGSQRDRPEGKGRGSRGGPACAPGPRAPQPLLLSQASTRARTGRTPISALMMQQQVPCSAPADGRGPDPSLQPRARGPPDLGPEPAAGSLAGLGAEAPLPALSLGVPPWPALILGWACSRSGD